MLMIQSESELFLVFRVVLGLKPLHKSQLINFRRIDFFRLEFCVFGTHTSPAVLSVFNPYTEITFLD